MAGMHSLDTLAFSILAAVGTAALEVVVVEVGLQLVAAARLNLSL